MRKTATHGTSVRNGGSSSQLTLSYGQVAEPILLDLSRYSQSI